ncbi:MAG TPA: protein kinase [Sandaracinaceae bacterium LLY-WYZ-13_1]|nr:protein kinase [Sandaracinaceae bacterium LLY-WYZ-13_1]
MRAPPMAYTGSAHPEGSIVISPGTIVGHKYRLDAPIGQGGMATVWRAVHTTLDRPVAVKFLEAVGAQSQQLAARFLREAKLAAGLRHRHVVDILDFGVAETGQPFMVMELLEGQSLADRYEDGPPVSDWELMEIVAMTLSGLAAVHDAGIVHRDVKPENVFLVEDADGIYPKLLDFGVSRGFGAEGRVTRTGAVVGTPQYMSPEQARGKKDLDHRSDLWAVGVMLYEGFAGEVPFDSENPGDVLISVATEEPAPLSQARPDLPEPVLALVHRALQKDPEARFGDARQMREMVLRVLEGADEMNGRPPSTVIRTSYASGAGTGKIRALSAPPAMPPPMPPGTEASPPPGMDETPGELDLSAPAIPSEAAELSTEKLPPPRGAGAPRKRSPWMAPLVGLAVLGLAAGAFFAFDGMGALERAGLVPGESARADSGASGEVRPGEAVATIARTPPEELPPEDVSLEPPPADGEPAPEAETVDVPSPPDPPDQAPEEALAEDAE